MTGVTKLGLNKTNLSHKNDTNYIISATTKLQQQQLLSQTVREGLAVASIARDAVV